MRSKDQEFTVGKGQQMWGGKIPLPGSHSFDYSEGSSACPGSTDSA
ncbi:hypothetical protein ACTL74_16780 [Pseudomonas aeruginosa]